MKQPASLPYLLELQAKIARSEKKAAKSKKEQEQSIKDANAAKSLEGYHEAQNRKAVQDRERIQAEVQIEIINRNQLKKEVAKLTEWLIDWGGTKTRDIEAAEKRGYDEAVKSWEHKKISQEKIIEELKGKVELARREGKEDGLGVGELERTRLQKKNEHLQRDSVKVVELQRELLAQSKVIDDLEEKVNIQSNENEKASKEKMQLKQQIHEKDSKLVTRNETIKKLEDARREEIENEARSLFDERRAKWEREEKPKELFDESSRILIQVILALDNGNQDSLPKELQTMAKKVKRIIGSEVDKEINREFWARVKVEAEKLAKTWFRQKWPEWSKANVEPKAKELEGMINANGMTSLSSLNWTVACKQCGTKQPFELTNERTSALMSRGVVQVQCVNQSCHHFLDLAGWYPYSFTVSLRELISAYLTQDGSRN